MKYYQQGDVLLKETTDSLKEGKKLDHLTLAEGEATGHHHRISRGNAALYAVKQLLYLKVMSEMCTLVHNEHDEIEVPKGTYIVGKVREYDHFNEEARYVAD